MNATAITPSSKRLLLALLPVLCAVRLLGQSVSAPDIVITEHNVGQVMALPLTLTMPEGGDFTQIQVSLTFPEGMEPAVGPAGTYCDCGDDIALKGRAPSVSFIDNCDYATWPNYTFIGANLAQTPNADNPCQFMRVYVRTKASTLDELPAGTHDFTAYVKYVQTDNTSRTVGAARKHAVLCHVTYPPATESGTQ